MIIHILAAVSSSAAMGSCPSSAPIETLACHDEALSRAQSEEDGAAMLEALEQIVDLEDRVLNIHGAPTALTRPDDFHQARQALRDAPAQLARLEALEPLRFRGRVEGPYAGSLELNGETRVIEMRFRGDEVAGIYLRASRTQPVELRVEDDAAEPVCSAASSAGRALCLWTPDADQTVQVHVRSAGDQAVNAQLLTN